MTYDPKLPPSCQAAQVQMIDILREEDAQASCCYKVAELPDACLKKIHEFERELNKQGYWNLALVAYQMEN